MPQTPKIDSGAFNAQITASFARTWSDVERMFAQIVAERDYYKTVSEQMAEEIKTLKGE